MPANDLSENYRQASSDVPQSLSKLLLELQRHDTPLQFDRTFWQRLSIERPNLQDFIYATSYRIAPNDPGLRGEVAAGLGDLVALLDRVSASEQLVDLWKSETDAASARAEYASSDEIAPPAV